MKRNISVLAGTLVLAGCMFMMTACGSGVSVPDEYNYDLSEYIKLGEYKGLPYDEEEVTVNQGDVEEYVKSMLEESKKTEDVKKGKVTKESVVNIDYVGYINGVEFEGGAGNETLDIDNSTFIEGFAEALIGHSVGENFDINVTFPENYGSDELAGKPAVFNITINSLQKEVLPEYDDKWVEKNTDFSNIKDFEADVRKNLKTEREKEARQKAATALFQSIVKSSELIKYPDKELDSRYNILVDGVTKSAEQYGMSLEDYLTQAYGMSKDDFEKNVKLKAENTVKEELVIHAIAKQENISCSDSEYGDYLNKLIEDAGYTADSFKEENGMTIEEYAATNNLFTLCLYDKVMEKVIEYCE